MPESINSKIKEQYDHDDSGGSLDTNLGDFLDSEGASGTSNNSKWRNWAEGTGTSLNTRLFNKHGGSGSFMTRWKNWIAFSSTHSFNFDGSNDCLDIPISGTLTAFTFSGWFNADVFENTNIWEWGTGSSERLGIWTWDNDFHVKLKDQTLITSAHGLSTGTWFHLANTYDGSTLTLYLNGSSFATASHSSVSTTPVGNLKIGRDSSAGSAYYWDGKVDEFAFWDVALSSSDITSVYNNGKIIDLSKSTAYGVDRTANLKLWLRCGDKAEPETSIARSDFYTDFDGTDDYVVTPKVSLDFTNISIVMWVKPIDFSSDDAFLCIADTDSNDEELLLYNQASNNNKFSAFLEVPDTEYNSTYEIPEGEWSHLAFTKSGDSLKLYANGIEVHSGSCVNNNTYSRNIFISARKQSSYSLQLESNISSTAVYKTALDAQTISQMAKSRFIPVRNSRFSVVDFDGGDDYISTNVNSTLTDGTYTFWAKATETGKNRGAFGHGGFKQGGFHFNYDDTRPFLRFGAGIYRYWNDNSAQDDGVWHHWAVILDSDDITSCKLYVDGVEQTVAETLNSGSYDAYTTALNIGRADSSNEWEGSMAQFAVYSDLKNSDFIYAQWSKGITADYSSDTNLSAYYRMGSDTSKAYPTIADSSSNSNDGTMTSMASDDIVQQMVAGYDMGAFESSSEELGGSEITSASNTTFSGVTSNDWTSSGATKSFSNDQMVFTMDGDSPAVVAQLSSGNFASGSGIPQKLLKVTLDIDSTTTGSYRINNAGGSCTANVFAKNPLTTGINTVYGLCDGANSYFRIFEVDASTGDKLVINSFDVQEVLQSEVSDTYPAIIDVNEPVLGVELWDADASTFDSGTHSWVKYGNNTITNDSGALKVTYVDNALGAYVWLKDASDISTDLTVGKTYKLTFDAKVNSGSSVNPTVSAYEPFVTVTETSFTTKSLIFTSTHATSNYFDLRNMGSGEIIWIDNLSLKEVQGNVGTMTNQATSDLVYYSVLPDQSFLTGVNSAYNYIDLDGADQYIDAGALDSALEPPLSISMWVKGNAQTSSTLIQDDSIHSGLLYLRGGSEIAFYSASGEKSYSYTLNNTWVNIVMTQASSAKPLVYVNGSLLSNGTQDATPNPSFSNIRIGGDNVEFNGSIGQTAIWNKELSSTEVGAIYTLGRHGNLLDSYSDNLKGYWAMSSLDSVTGLSDSISTIYDRSGNSNHGTPQNADAGDLKISPNATPNGYSKGETNRSNNTP